MIEDIRGKRQKNKMLKHSVRYNKQITKTNTMLKCAFLYNRDN